MRKLDRIIFNNFIKILDLEIYNRLNYLKLMIIICLTKFMTNPYEIIYINKMNLEIINKFLIKITNLNKLKKIYKNNKIIIFVE